MDFAGSSLRMGYITPRLAFESGVSPAINTFARDDVAMGSVLSALKPAQLAQRRQTGSNFVTTSIVYADVPNLLVPINRAGLYAFDYWLLYETNDVAEGIGVQLAFTGTAACSYSVEAYTDLTTRAPLVIATAFGSGLAPYAAGPGAGKAIINIRGSMSVSVIGDLKLQARAETGGANSATILTSSWGRATAEPG